MGAGMKVRLLFVREIDDRATPYCVGGIPDHAVDHLDEESWLKLRHDTISTYCPDYAEAYEVREIDVRVGDDAVEALFAIPTVDAEVDA